MYITENNEVYINGEKLIWIEAIPYLKKYNRFKGKENNEK